MKEKKSKKKFLFAIGIVLLAVACGVLAGISAFSSKKRAVIYQVPEGTEVQAVTDKGTNILVLGTDREAALCDVMMLVNVAFESRRITVAHIPRDTYARYTEKSYKKLNGVYNTLGGAAEAADFLSDAFDIDIDHYICIGLDTLGDVVDAVGGVEVDIPRDMQYYDPASGLYIDLKEGKTLLDGDKAEQFLRYRSGYADGDLGRIEAQKLFICSFFYKLANEMNPIMAGKICAAANGVETDMSISKWLEFGMKILSISDGKVGILTLPGEHVIATKSGASYFCLSAPSNAEIMKKYFGGGDGFDKNECFLNPDYTEFANAYKSKKDYTVASIEKIVGDNVKK